MKSCDEDQDKCRLILDSKLFEPVSEDRFVPVHRQVAEFLAAKFAATSHRVRPSVTTGFCTHFRL